MTDLTAPTLVAGSSSQHTLMEQMYHVDQAFHHLNYLLNQYAPAVTDYPAEVHEAAREAWFERLRMTAAMRNEFREVARAIARQREAA